MGSSLLRLYRLSPLYARELHRADARVMSCEPAEGKASRPLVGIVVVNGDRLYCIPLSSPKPKHFRMKADRDFSKIVNRSGKLIGVLNFNNMVPVADAVVDPVDLRPRQDERTEDRAYKELMRDQLEWCNANRDLIRRKAAKLYEIVVERPDSAPRIVRRCCDFAVLERILDQWLERA